MDCGVAGEHVFCTQMPAPRKQEEEVEEENTPAGEAAQVLPNGELQQPRGARTDNTSEPAEGAS